MTTLTKGSMFGTTMISHYESEDVMEKMLRHPNATVGTDGFFGGRPHPCLYGTFPRFIHELVYNKKMFTQWLNKKFAGTSIE
jgi:N-acyl-D-amino-acid deacylase